jgi:hypothetical protein
MDQWVQLLGALLIISAYVSWQQKKLALDSVRFMGMNMVGAGILTVVAAVNRDYGFLILEGMWTWVAARGLRRALKAKRIADREAAKRKASQGRFNRPTRKRPRHNPLRRVD